MEEQESNFYKDLVMEVEKEFYWLSQFGIENIDHRITKNGTVVIHNQQLVGDFWVFYNSITNTENNKLKKALEEFDKFVEWGEKKLDVEFEFFFFFSESGRVSIYVKNIEEISKVLRVGRLITKIKHATLDPVIEEFAAEVEMKVLFQPEEVEDAVEELVDMVISEHADMLKPLELFYENQIKEVFARIGSVRNQLKRQYKIF